MEKKILITGSTGLIGSALLKYLLEQDHFITIFTRSPENAKDHKGEKLEFIKWEPSERGDWEIHLNGKDAVIHLAGAPIFGKRWSESYKHEIFRSRQIGTRGLVNAISKSENKPKVFISASGVGYYGTSETKIFSEEDKSPGNDFLSKVCIAWEEEAAKVEEFGVRRVSVRTGIVLDKNDGALAQMLTPFKFFAGGAVGSGKQWMSWIHIDDIIRIYDFALKNSHISGALNAVAPNPVTMQQLTDEIGKVLGKPSWLKVPEAAVKIAFGEAAEAITTGQKVIPEKLQNLNYEFMFPEIESALRNLLK